MTIKSQTHKGKGFNELRFEDEAGQEEIFVHAQKDHSTKVLHDRYASINGTDSKIIYNDKREAVVGQKQVNVGGGYAIVVSSGNEKFQRATSDRKQFDQLPSLFKRVKDFFPNAPARGLSVIVDSIRNVWVGGADITNVGAAKTTNVAGQYSILTGGTMQMTSQRKFSVNAAVVDIAALDDLHLSVGQSRISMLKDGTINIKGKAVNLISTHEANIESAGEVTVDASTSVSIIGGKIKLN